MKRLIKFSTFALGAIILATSCDIVDDPYAHLDDDVNRGEDQYNDTVFNDSTGTSRRIFLEEFTGHTCPNCPAGQDLAKQLVNDHPDELVVVSIHNSGAFSAVQDPPYDTDFETETGEKLRVFYQIQAYPAAIFNRTEINGQFWIQYQTWPNVVDQLLADTDYMRKRIQLNVTSIYNTENRSLRILPTVRALEDIAGDISIIAYVAESHIISAQVDSRQSPSDVLDYEHNHLLRAGFPQDGDGKVVLSAPVAGDEFKVLEEADELRTSISEEWVAENCEVFVFAVESTTGEILQTEHFHMTNP